MRIHSTKQKGWPDSLRSTFIRCKSNKFINILPSRTTKAGDFLPRPSLFKKDTLMTSSPDISELSKALFSIQNNLSPAIKDARNTFVGNDYAILNSVMETCRDALYSHGIWLVQLPCPAKQYIIFMR